MDLSDVLDQLREELANIDAAILSLEGLQQEAPRRSRPSKASIHLSRTPSAGKGSTADDTDSEED